MAEHFKEEELVVSPEGGMKCDKSKIKWHLAPWDLFKKIAESKTKNPELMWDIIPFEPLEELVKVMTYGANKYEKDNWKGVEVIRYFDSCMRHLIARFIDGETIDESGLPVTSHINTNAVFINYLDLQENKKDGKKS